MRPNNAVIFLLGLLLIITACQFAAGDEAMGVTPAEAGSSSFTPISARTIDRLAPAARLGHGNATRIFYDAANDLLAVATTTGVYLYEAATGERVDFFPTDEPVSDVAVSADGELLALLMDSTNTTQLWQIADHTLITPLVDEVRQVRGVQFAPDESLLVHNFGDGWLVTDLETEQSLPVNLPQGTQIGELTFSADGQLLAALSTRNLESTIEIKDAASGTTVHAVQFEQGMQVRSGEFSPDGALFAAVASEEFGEEGPQLLLWRLEDDGPPMALEAPEGVIDRAWAFGPDGSQVAAGLLDGSIALWLTDDAKPDLLTREIPSKATALMFSPDGQWLIVGRVDGGIEFWRLEDRSLEQRITVLGDAVMQLLPAGDQSLLAATADGLVAAFNIQDNELAYLIADHALGAVQSIAFAPDGQLLAAGHQSGAVELWDSLEGVPKQSLLTHGGTVQSISFSPDQELMATGVGERVSPLAFDDTVRILQWPENAVLYTFNGDQEDVVGCSGYRNNLSFSADGRLLAGTAHDFTVRVWDVNSGKEVRRLAGHSGPVYDVTFSSDGTLLASAADDGFVRVWRTDNFRLVAELINELGGITSIAFSPDGQTLASSNLFGVINLWDVENWQLRESISSAKNRFSNLAFSRDGSLLAAGAADNQIQFWDASTLAPAGQFTGHHGLVTSVSFSLDGGQLASGATDGTIQLWRVGQN